MTLQSLCEGSKKKEGESRSQGEKPPHNAISPLAASGHEIKRGIHCRSLKSFLWSRLWAASCLNSLISPPFLWLCYQSLHGAVKTRREHTLKKYVPSALSMIYYPWKRTLTVEICCRGAGVAGSGIQGVWVAALALRVPGWAGGGEGGGRGRGVARVLIHLLKLPLEKPTHGVSESSLHREAEGAGR